MTLSTHITNPRRIRTTTAPIRDTDTWDVAGVYDRMRSILGYDVREIGHSEQVWFWTESWQHKEHEADEDIASGRTTVCRSNDEFLGLLGQ